ncbi:MAG: hypothetical protein HUU38_09480 [Anaerolineales bacterium]|nr:hypothetical protein [Anaerolineales bacterium]
MKHSASTNTQQGILPPPQSNTSTRFKMLIRSAPAPTCPFLGLKNDPETLTNFASEDNFCHCNGHPRTMPLDHQQMFCLFGYTQCPIFLKRMAAEVRAREKAERKLSGLALKPSLGMVAVLTNLLGIK